MFASILMLGGTFIAFYSGFDKFFNVHDHSDLLNNYPYIAVALVCSILFEAWAVASASKAVLHEVEIEEKNPFKSFFISLKYIRKTKSPTTKFVWYEDVAALTGVVVAFIALRWRNSSCLRKLPTCRRNRFYYHRFYTFDSCDLSFKA